MSTELDYVTLMELHYAILTELHCMNGIMLDEWRWVTCRELLYVSGIILTELDLLHKWNCIVTLTELHRTLHECNYVYMA